MERPRTDSSADAGSTVTTPDTVTANCGLCSANCGVLLTVLEGRITAVRGDKEHPVTRGYLCPKGAALGEIQSAPDRLSAPLRKTAGGGWEELSWEDALEHAAGGLADLRERYGAESVAFHVGRAGIGREFIGYVQRFAEVFGSPNFSCAGSHCHYGKEMGNVLTYGTLPVPDFAHSSCIILWGDNPDQSLPARKQHIAEARERGAALIVVDPTRNGPARTADIHLRPLPGTDVALALGLIHVVIAERLYDQPFVEQWTVGFDRLAERASAYPPERVAVLTGVPEDQIVAAARLYGGSRPACVGQGNALELHRNGVQAARAVACLQAICGGLDVPGGGLFPLRSGLASLRVGKSSVRPAIGADEFPLFFAHRGQAQANLFSRAILEEKPYPLKGLVVVGSNPLVQWPGAARLPEAFGRLELLIVMDTSHTATTRAAHLVLPAALAVERDELWDAMSVDGEPLLGLAPPAVERPGAWSDWRFWNSLAQRMGYQDAFPWSSPRDALDWRLAPLGITSADLLERPDGYRYGERSSRSYERAGFRTPSGKVELYSQALADRGHDPLPGYEIPTPDAAFPLVLTAGARTVGYIHSRYRNVQPLRRLQPEPFLEAHPQTGRSAGLAEGELALVTSAHGSVRVAVRFADDLDPRVLRMPHGWEAANVNLLSGTELEDLDPISGFPCFRSMSVRLEPAGPALLS